MARRWLIARQALMLLWFGLPLHADDLVDRRVVPAVIDKDAATNVRCECRRCRCRRDPFQFDSEIHLIGGIESVVVYRPLTAADPVWSAGIGFGVWCVVAAASPWLLYLLLKRPLWNYSSATQAIVSAAWMGWALSSSWFCWGQMIPRSFFVLSLFPILALATLYFVFICDLVEDHRLDQ